MARVLETKLNEGHAGGCCRCGSPLSIPPSMAWRGWALRTDVMGKMPHIYIAYEERSTGDGGSTISV